MGTDAFDDDLQRFVAGDGLAYARRLVKRFGMPHDLAEDLVQETSVAVKRAQGRDLVIDNVAAYATGTMHNLAKGLMRGQTRGGDWFADLPPLPDGAGPGQELAAFDSYDLGSSPVSSTDVRAAVARHLGERPWPAAGALALLCVRDLDDPATPAGDCPQPKGGATPREAAAWVGLFYAGRRDCWPGDDDPPKVRQRRSRYVKAQDAVLAAAAEEVGLRPGADHV